MAHIAFVETSRGIVALQGIRWVRRDDSIGHWATLDVQYKNNNMTMRFKDEDRPRRDADYALIVAAMRQNGALKQ